MVNNTRESLGIQLIRVEGDAMWIRVVVNSKNYWTSMRSAINESLYLPEWGGQCPDNFTLNSTDQWCYADDGSGDRIWTQTADFSRFVFFFFMLAIIMAALNFYTQYDTAYPGAFLWVVMPIVILMSGINGFFPGHGFFYMDGATRFEFLNNWIFALNVIMLWVIYLFTTNKRYQAG